MVYIRLDVNSQIGMGHAMRCLSIADALRSLGKKVTFITADNTGEELLKERGYDVVCLNGKWDAPQQELEGLLKFIQENPAEYMIVDKYEISENYLKKINEVIKVVYIDDLNRFIYPCDCLIAYANYYEKFQYPKHYKDTKLLLGTKYVPLRKEYSDQKEKQINSSGSKVIFLSGGTDNYGVAITFVRELIKQQVLDMYHIRIICGAFHKDIEQLRALEKEYENNLEILVQVKDMWNYMQWADMAVSAGGTTLYELSACGTPFITYTIADNQFDNVKTFEKDNHIYYAGDMRKEPEKKMKHLVCKLNLLRNDIKQREEISKSLQQLVDGKGSMRIAEALSEGKENDDTILEFKGDS